MKEGIERIAGGAFGGFSNSYKITSVSIPESVKIINCWAFDECYSLKKAYFADPAGWVCYDNNDGSESQRLKAEELSDADTAAQYLKNKNAGEYNWVKED